MKILVSCWSCLFCLALGAQTPSSDTSAATIHIYKSANPIGLDGVLQEEAWAQAMPIQHFLSTFPIDTGLANARTEVKITYDDKYMYFGVVCWQNRADYTVQSLRRDFPAGTSDVLNVLIDPFNDGLNGFLFSVSPLNVQREALISNGGDLSFEWDNKWFSAVKNYDDHWDLEIAIPFKTLRYKVTPGEYYWRMNFIRNRMKNWETSTWQHVPIVFRPNNLAFTGKMVFESAPPKQKVNFSLIPYAIGSAGVDFIRQPGTLELDKKERSQTGNIGGDAKIGLTPGLNLDLTINPDFSQVEVDQQVANLSRFELFFPERRQFFLENRDLFSMFGFPNTRPFFSRRIGLAYNPVSKQYEKVPIIAGARLSGKLTNDWRIGVLNMQTGKKAWNEQEALPGANFTVATVQKKMFERSTLSAIFVNKQNLLSGLNDTQRAGWQPWNRVAGLEYNLYSKDNRWEGEWYYHQSFSPDSNQRGNTLAGFLGFFDRKGNVRLGYNRISDHYTAEAGFVPRQGIQGFFPGAGINFYPKNKLGKYVASSNLGVDADFTFNLDNKLYDRDLSVNLETFFKDQSALILSVSNVYTYLFDDFDPTNLYRPGDSLLLAGTDYVYNTANVSFFSSTTYDWRGSVNLSVGEYFNGNIISLNGDVGYRWQPVGLFSIQYSYNKIDLPAPYASAQFWLVGPRAEISFSRSVFLSAFFQYNTQANNFNINTRLQWRFAPVSDLFLVYTDNSFAQPIADTRVRFFSPKNRALVLKAVYWI